MRCRTPLLLFIGLLLWQCTPQNEVDSLTNGIDSLKNEIGILKKDLEECKYGPSKLLAEAKSLRASGDLQGSKERLDQLITRHQGASEFNEAQQLKSSIEQDIKKAEIAEEKEREKAIAEEKQRLANATAKMSKKHDEMQEITWYRDKSSPKFVNYNGFYCYIAHSAGSTPSLRLAIQYAADDWLFIEQYIIKVDGVTYTITEDQYGEIETDNGSGEIWEWLDRYVESDELEIIKAVAYGVDAKIRFSGKQYYKDRTITSAQKQALRNVLDAYVALGGRL